MTPQPLPKMLPFANKRINLLAWKARNQRNSILLGISVFLLLAAIAYAAALALDPQRYLLFIAIAVAIAATQNVVAYWFGDQIALNVSGARPATLEENRYLVNISEAVAIGAGIPMPKLYVIDSPAPNAFATGRNPENSSVAVTSGLIAILDRQELEGVIAHELAHIKNYDVLLMSMIAATVGALVILRDVVWRSRFYGSKRRYEGDKNANAQMIALLVLFVLLIIAPLLATLLRFAVSRKREYLADASAAYITRNPEGLANALEKIRDYTGEPLKVSEGIQHLFFSNPSKRFKSRSLFATHPPLEERIARLRSM